MKKTTCPKQEGVLVAPQTFLVVEQPKGLTAAVALLENPDSVIVEMVVSRKRGQRVLMTHITDQTDEHPSTLAIWRAAKIPRNQVSEKAACRITCVDPVRGLAVLNSLRREMGQKKVDYELREKAWGACVALDLLTGQSKSWRDVSCNLTLRELAPPATWRDRVMACCYKWRNGILSGFRNKLYLDQFPEPDGKCGLRKHKLNGPYDGAAVKPSFVLNSP